MSDTYNINFTEDELNLIVDALVEYDENQPCNVYGIDISLLVTKINKAIAPQVTPIIARQGYLYEDRFYEDKDHIIPIYGKNNEVYIDLANSNNVYGYIESKFIPIGSYNELLNIGVNNG